MTNEEEHRQRLLQAYREERYGRVDDYRRPDIDELAAKMHPLASEHALQAAREENILNIEKPIWPIIQGAGIPSTFNMAADVGPGLNQAEAILWANASAHEIAFGNDGYTDGTNIGIMQQFFSLNTVFFPTGDCTFSTFLDLIDKDENPLLTYQIDTVCSGFVFTSTYTRPTNTIQSFNGIRTRVSPNQPGLNVFWSFWYVLGRITVISL